MKSKDSLEVLLQQKQIHSWEQMLEHIRKLPYGRNANRFDFNLVLEEGRGSCSSKHALLKQVADLKGIPDVQLILGIYRMNKLNTPGIGTVLEQNDIDYIPEAHCYLKIGGERFDYTSEHADFENIRMDVLAERVIEPEQVSEYKVEFHKTFVRDWLRKSAFEMDFEQLWAIRETCISNLTNKQ